MKKLISLGLAVVAVLTVAAEAKAGGCYGPGCNGGFDFDTVVVSEMDTVTIRETSTAKITANSSSQAISGFNTATNTGDFSDVRLTTKTSNAGLFASTVANSNTTNVFTNDVVKAKVGGRDYGWSINSAYASSTDTVSVILTNTANITHNASSVAISGENKVVNTGNGCGVCNTMERDWFCGPQCGYCQESNPVDVRLTTGEANANAASVVVANTNLTGVSTNDVVSASVYGGGSGVDMAVASEKDTIAVTVTNTANLTVGAYSGAASGQNTVTNTGDFGNVNVTTGNANSDLTSVVVANTNVTVAH